MIELIFVIVILGILAAVALPRFASIQDDANIAAEKSVIGSIRSGLQVIKGRALANSTRDVNITFMDASGQFHYANLGKMDRRGACGDSKQYCGLDEGISFSGHPNSLGLKQWSGDGGNSPAKAVNETNNVGRVSGVATGSQGSPAGALILEPDGRDTLQTFTETAKAGVFSDMTPGVTTPTFTAMMIANPQETGGKSTIIIGQATRQVSDTGLELCVGKGWHYNSASGSITLGGVCLPH
jgi:type II secretory pathway pseudopilin PulG